MTVAGALDLLKTEVERAGQQLSPLHHERWPIVPKLRVNREIRVREVRVIGPEGEQLGILPTPEAFKQAQEGGYDLVEVAPTSVPPVCRIMDYGKYKYELSKKITRAGATKNQLRSRKSSCVLGPINMTWRSRSDRSKVFGGGQQDEGRADVPGARNGQSGNGTGRHEFSDFGAIAEAGTIEYAPRMEGAA